MLKKLSVYLIGLMSSGLMLFGSLAIPASAQFSPNDQVGLKTIGQTAYEQSNAPKDVRLIIGEAIKTILSLIGFILIILMIISGIQYMTALGNKAKIDSALGRIKNAFFGLVIILISYAATIFIINQLNNALKIAD
ncbi:MAG TPA: hypothetical protein PKN62_00880 [bacterium]|nr:hypothetical protein [bacterium]